MTCLKIVKRQLQAPSALLTE